MKLYVLKVKLLTSSFQSSTLSLAKPYFFTYDYLHASFTAKKAADLAFVAANVNGCEKVWFTNYLDDQNVFEVDKDDMVLKGTNLFCAVFALPLPLYFENAGNSKNADFYIREQNSSKVLLMPESSKTTSGYVIVEPYDQSKENPKIHIKSDEYEVQEQFQGYLDFPARSSNTSVPWLWIGLFTAAALVIVGLIIFIVYSMRRNQRGGSYQIVATENKIDTL